MLLSPTLLLSTLLILACNPKVEPSAVAGTIPEASPEASASAAAVVPLDDELRREAVLLLQGQTESGIPGEEEIREVATALAQLRAGAVEVAAITVRPEADPRSLMLGLLDGPQEALLSSVEDYKQPFSGPTGLAELDALNTELGVTEMKCSMKCRMLALQFEQPLDVVTVAQRYQAEVPDLKWAEVNGTIGDGSTILLQERGEERWTFVVRVGSGDCPAGCTHETFTTWHLDRASGAVEQGEMSERGSGGPQTLQPVKLEQ